MEAQDRRPRLLAESIFVPGRDIGGQRPARVKLNREGRQRNRPGKIRVIVADTGYGRSALQDWCQTLNWSFHNDDL